MNYLDTVKGKIADYIVKDEVVETDDVISAYTIVSLLKEQSKKLRHVREMEKALLDKLDDIYPQDTVTSKRKLFRKRGQTGFDYFSGICSYIYDNSSIIELQKRANGYIYLRKDFHFDGIYSDGDRLTEEAYCECADDLYSIFGTLERYGKLFTIDKNSGGRGQYNATFKSISNTISSEGFDVTFKFTTENDGSHPTFSYEIGLNKEFDPSGIATNHFYGQDNNLDKLIHDNEETILRNTPVKISELSSMFCMLVLDYKDKQKTAEEKKRIDGEIDREFQKLYATQKVSE